MGVPNPFQRRYKDPFGAESILQRGIGVARGKVDVGGTLRKIGLLPPIVETVGPKWYRYTAISPTGVRHKGKMQGPSNKDISVALQNDGWIPLSIEEMSTTGMNTDLASLAGGDVIKFNIQEIATFSRQLAELLRAGVPLSRALASLGEEQAPKISRLCTELSAQVASGVPLSDALKRFPGVFDEVFRSYVAAGESAGTLPETMVRLAKNVEKRAMMQQKIKSVTAYPKFVSMAIGGIIGGIITLLVPMYAKIYASFGATLPKPTLVLLAISNNALPFSFTKTVPMPWFMDEGLTIPGLFTRLFAIIFLFLGFEGLRLYRGKPRNLFKLIIRVLFISFITIFAKDHRINIISILVWGTVIAILVTFTIWKEVNKDNAKVVKKIDSIMFRLPLFGAISMRGAQFRWSSTMAGALTSGVPIASALLLAAGTTGSRWYAMVAKDLMASVRAGKPLSEGLAFEPILYPASIRAMVATGEQTGDLATMMDSVANAVDSETDALIAGLAAKIEVALLLTMGIVVGGLLLVLYLPILNLASAGFTE
jgi:type II secretory pathway component PulF